MMILYYISLSLFMTLCLLLCVTVLIQESKSLGLGASFGGDASDSLFGTSTADVLKQFTAVLIGLFFVSCLILSLWTNNIGSSADLPVQPEIQEVQQ